LPFQDIGYDQFEFSLARRALHTYFVPYRT